MIYRLVRETNTTLILNQKGIEKPGVECVQVTDHIKIGTVDRTTDRTTIKFEDGREITCILKTVTTNNITMLKL